MIKKKSRRSTAEEDSREKYKPEETFGNDEVKWKGNSHKNKVGTTQPEKLRGYSTMYRISWVNKLHGKSG